MSTQQIQEIIWNLRTAQSNANSPELRKQIEQQIQKLYKMLDGMKG